MKSRILFTDECTFFVDGFLNNQNYRMWATHNPRATWDRYCQVREKVNVWCGILGTHILGPFFFDGNLNGKSYLQFLQNVVMPALYALELNYNVMFMHDGCPAHSTVPVTQYLNNVFRDNWIGRFGPQKWPARSPDLNPLDFFYWGFMKNTVFNNQEEPVTNLEELRNKILTVSATITVDMLRNVNNSFYNRLGFCLAVNGGHFEPLL